MNLPPQTGRSLLPAGLVLAAGLGLLAACSGRADPEGTPRRIAREVDRALTTVAQNELVHDPELATALGLSPEAAGYPFSRFLTDRSQAAFERARLERLETLDVLVRTARPAPGSALARHLDTVIAAHEAAEAVLVAGHGTGNLSAFYPYVADHMRGAYIDVPELLVRRQPVKTAEDADAFLARAAQFAGTIDDERRRLEADAQSGVTPPAPVLARMVRLVQAGAVETPETSILVQTFDNLLGGVADLKPEARAQRAARMRTLLSDSVTPAYARFAETLERLSRTAPAEPGIWQIEGGDAYYRAVLSAYTGTSETPAELHARGLAEVARMERELDAALKLAGYIEGTPGQRLSLLARQPGQIYEDSDLGRAALIERLAQIAVRARALTLEQIGTGPSHAVTVSKVPIASLAGTASARYTPRSADGRQSARFEINLTRMADWPDFSLATLVFHETMPGHHLESALSARQPGVPLANQLIWNAGYSEGWASYAETLADEGGLYTDDPLGRIGYLQSMLLRAARLVADTGIHQQKWTRARAVDYLVSVTGLSLEAASDEVDRYSVWPGQAPSYWIGRQRILDLRERAQRVLGPRFEPQAFHAVILGGGPRPLDMVEADVTRWYTEAAR